MRDSMHAFRLLALLVLMSTAATALAQDAQPLTEAAFWQQLTATRNELEAVVLVPAAQVDAGNYASLEAVKGKVVFMHYPNTGSA
ncbi:MAG: hypothetical protein AAF653_08885, partial [Chloroflexota bacterium]